MRAILALVLIALPAAAFAQREAPAGATQMIAPTPPCYDEARKMCMPKPVPTLACDVCNPIVPGQPMTPELVTEAPKDPLHQPSNIEQRLRPKSKDLAKRPASHL
jgi:hypothetical protein